MSSRAVRQGLKTSAVAEAATHPLTIEGLAGTQTELWSDIGKRDMDSALCRLHGLSDGMSALIERVAGRMR